MYKKYPDSYVAAGVTNDDQKGLLEDDLLFI